MRPLEVLGKGLLPLSQSLVAYTEVGQPSYMVVHRVETLISKTRESLDFVEQVIPSSRYKLIVAVMGEPYRILQDLFDVFKLFGLYRLPRIGFVSFEVLVHSMRLLGL